MTMVKFPSLEQFRTAIRAVQERARYVGQDDNGDPIFDHTVTLPTIEYNGTVKLHGTNAAIVWHDEDEHPQFQSRSNVLSEGADNAGFWKWGQDNLIDLEEMLLHIGSFYNKQRLSDHTIAVFGEWCGGGIQKGVAITELPKMFVIFAVRIDDEWQDITNLRVPNAPLNVFVITEFPTWSVEIDFEAPHIAQNKLVELTEAVEAECPVGKHFGVSGVGEGIVWQPADPAWNDSRFWFKVKGEKHQSSKVETLAPVDVEAIAKVNDFVTYAVTESRLEQGLQEMAKPFEMSSLGDFIRWLISDITKEEQDTITVNNLDMKKINPAISNVARKWYITKLNSD